MCRPAPHTEAADALAMVLDPRLILPTDLGAWGEQDNVRLSLRWSPRSALTDGAWRAMASVQGVPRGASAYRTGATAARALAAALDALGDADVPPPLPMARQLAQMEHERRIATHINPWST